MPEYDIAIVYFGLTRSTKKVFETHKTKIFDILDKHNVTYKKFMHTWKTKDDIQLVWENIDSKKIDYEEYKLLSPDFYKLENQENFTENLTIDDYFYKDVWDKYGNSIHGEWPVRIIINHLCALESIKRGLEMVESFVNDGNSFKYVMFVRPDVEIGKDLPITEFFNKPYDINIPDEAHYEGYNDRFAILTYDKAPIYGKRINEIVDFRKTQGRIVSEKYVKYIVTKYDLKVNLINFSFALIRP
jgi:hypothetical protein